MKSIKDKRNKSNTTSATTYPPAANPVQWNQQFGNLIYRSGMKLDEHSRDTDTSNAVGPYNKNTFTKLPAATNGSLVTLEDEEKDQRAMTKSGDMRPEGLN